MGKVAKVGDRALTEHGYVRIKVGRDHHLAMIGDGWAYEHMVVMEEKLGRHLQSGELVHHEDDNKTNNDPYNLTLTDRPAHCITHLPRLGTSKPTCARGHDKQGQKKCRVCAREQERARYWRDKHGN